MSEENVELARRLWKKLGAGMERGDPGAWLDSKVVADDWELVMPIPFEGRTVWRGRPGFVEFMRRWAGEFEDYSIRLEQIIDAGDDRVVALYHQRGTGKGSGVPVEWHLGNVVEFEDGRLIRTRMYFDPSEALEAARVSK